ncbi:WD40 repeat domain-containing protein [Paenibacillus mesophilus]|uniref:WD40 repeat domain-containing protein n=1 Tax=Paenibacillus mesophilus TaxID=2582849 RepID=UPI00110E148D|nr:WD40 repeat domain-containing protein [Paenibacillus mesophilus]TMV48561.1 WD40 repeat domain-containing protein [Paenibacillus mesophilus]
MKTVFNRIIGPPEQLGEPVRCRLGQAAAVGVTPKGEKELYFASNGLPATFYVLDLVKRDIKFSFDIPGSNAVWAMAVASDGNVYFSSSSDGVLYRYSPETRQVTSVAASADDFFVWDIQAADNGTVVSATYPHSKVFEYNIETARFSDLGRMSEEEQYARSVAVTANYIYSGIGSTIRLFRFDRSTCAKEELHIDGFTGEKGFIDRIWVMHGLLFLSVNQQEIVIYDEIHRRITGRFDSVGAVVHSEKDQAGYYFVHESKLLTYDRTTCEIKPVRELPGAARSAKIKLMQWMTLSGPEWATIAGAHIPDAATDSSPRHTVGEKSVLMIVSGYADVWYYDPQTNDIHHRVLDVPSKPLLIQSIEADEDGMLYIGGYHRGLCLYSTTEERILSQIPAFPQIEGMGFLNGKVYFGTYTKANVYVYDKSRPLNMLPDDRMAEANPRFAFPIGHQQDRPFTLASGEHQLYIGTIPDYGLNTGALTVYYELEDEWTVYPEIAPNLSIVGLAYKDGLLYGGTSIWGGIGKGPAENVAHLFIWDTVKKEIVKRFIPDIPDLDTPPLMIGELSAGPDGNIWGAVYGTIFVMEPVSGKVIRSRRVCESQYIGKFRPVYLRWGTDGLLYTALGRKLVVVDPGTLDYEIIDHGPLSIMALGQDGHLYYALGSELYRRKLSDQANDASSRILSGTAKESF